MCEKMLQPSSHENHSIRLSLTLPTIHPLQSTRSLLLADQTQLSSCPPPRPHFSACRTSNRSLNLEPTSRRTHRFQHQAPQHRYCTSHVLFHPSTQCELFASSLLILPSNSSPSTGRVSWQSSPQGRHGNSKVTNGNNLRISSGIPWASTLDGEASRHLTLSKVGEEASLPQFWRSGMARRAQRPDGETGRLWRLSGRELRTI